MEQTNKNQLNATSEEANKGGVKTEEGKAVVRFNAVKHGILGDLVAKYEEDFYKRYLEQLFDEIKPETLLEQILTERIALHYLKLYRVSKAEAEHIRSFLEPTEMVDFGDALIVKEGYKPLLDDVGVEKLLSIYSRYETTIENRLYRAMKELRESRRR